jgi:hypothetical protein
MPEGSEWSFSLSELICVDLWLHLFRAFKSWDARTLFFDILMGSAFAKATARQAG